MLVRPEVIDDPPALLAVNHVGIESAWVRGFEVSNPGDGFSAQRIDIGIVPDHERNATSPLGEHDSPPTAEIQEGQREELSPPDLIHDALADRRAPILAAESKSFLNARMQKF